MIDRFISVNLGSKPGGREMYVSRLFRIDRHGSAVKARLHTKLAAFLSVTCVVTIGPTILSNTNVGTKTLTYTAYLNTNVVAVYVNVFTGHPLTYTSNLNVGTVVTNVTAAVYNNS